MSKTILVNVVNAEESRIAIVADGRLEELSIETAQHEQIEGNIYKARIVKVIASLDAVFVDYGRERNGFLAAPDIHPEYFREERRDVSSLRKGQELLVQVRKGEIGSKGAALTTYVSLPGRHFVLMPQVSKRGVSRKIEDEATRKQLRKVLDDSGIPEEMGYIARTAAAGRTKQELTRDAGYLLRLWKSIQARHETAKAPALLYQETDIVIRTLRDYFTPSVDEVLVDDEAMYRQVLAFFQAVMPWHQKRLRLHQAQAPLFSKYNLEDQIASIYAKTVPLPSGGSIIIEQTEALVSIDVNSGKTTSGKDIEETALIANKEAAAEAARQLRLRDMGGLIVIDFIDMRPSKNRSEVRRVLQKELKEDKARTDTGTISKFGLLELSRQRIKGVARAGAASSCPTCSGLGHIRTPESAALAVLRQIQQRLPRKGTVRQVLAGVPATVATLLQNRQRAQITDLENQYGAEILVFSEPALAPNQYYLEYRTNDRPQVETNLPEGFNRAQLLASQGLPDIPVRIRRPAPYPLAEAESEAEAPADDVENSGGEPQLETTAAPQPEATAESGKKRRRRRRRKAKSSRDESPEKTEPTAAVQPTTAAEPGEQGSPVPTAETAGETQPAAAEAEQPPSTEKPISASAKRRRRRRRATTRKDSGEEPAAAGDATEPTPAEPEQVATPAAEGGAVTTGTEPPTEEAPAKSPRPRSRRSKQETPAPAEQLAAAAADDQEVATSVDSTGTEPVEKKPAPRRRRTKPAELTTASDVGDTEKPAPKKRRSRKQPTPGETADNPEPEAATTDPDPGEAAKPRRRSRKKPTPAEPTPAPAEDTRAAAAEAAPKPRRRTRKKPAQAEVPVTPPEDAPTVAADKDAPPAKKPARRPRKRKAPTPAEAGDGGADPDSEPAA